MSDIIGGITPPPPFQGGAGQYGGYQTGLIAFFNNVIRLLIVVAGIWAFINLILAGYGFLGAGDDPKKIEAAQQKIWQSMFGLILILSSFVLVAIFGYLLFGDPTIILKPKIYGP
jgi:hypothetical protein